MTFLTLWKFLLKNKLAFLLGTALGLVPLFLFNIASAIIHIIIVPGLIISVFVSIVMLIMRKKLVIMKFILIVCLTYLLTLNLGTLFKDIYYKNKVETFITELIKYKNKHGNLPNALNDLQLNIGTGNISYTLSGNQDFLVSYVSAYWRVNVYGSNEGEWIHFNSLGTAGFLFIFHLTIDEIF